MSENAVSSIVRPELEPAPCTPAEAVKHVRRVAVEIAALHAAGRFHGELSELSIAIGAEGSAIPAADAPQCTVGRAGDSWDCVPAEMRDVVPIVLSRQLETAREQLQAADVGLDPREIDVYQLGALLCRLLSGASADAFLRSPRAKARVPRKLVRLVERALGGSDQAPFTDAREVVAALDAVASDDTGAIAQASTHHTLVGVPIAAAEQAGTEARDDLPFDSLGHFQIVSKIGHGGMGDVFLGYEKSLDRWVAIKVLPEGLCRDAEAVRRFRDEAIAAAKLVHPNVVQTYFIGEDRGRQFFAMQYVDGVTLHKLLSRERLSIDHSLAIIDEVLSGLAAAHRQGLVHRDIKPANVLIDKQNRRALIADFGLAKSLDDASRSRTAAGVVLGTVDYMSPEQARGRPVDQRSDLYSLGVMLFQMLCGRLPFVAEKSAAAIYQHVHEAPPRASDLSAEVSPELSALVGRLLEKSPADRYQQAEEVLADVRAIRAGRAPLAHLSDPARALAGVPAGDRLTAAFPGSSVATRSGSHPGEQLTAPLETQRQGRRQALRILAMAALGGGVAGVGLFASLSGWGRKDGAKDTPSGPPAWTGPRPPGQVREYLGHSDAVNSIVLSVGGKQLLSGARDGRMRLWNFETAELLKEIKASYEDVRRVRFAPDGRHAFTCSADQTARTWDLETGRQVNQFSGHVEMVLGMAVVPGRDEIVTASRDCRLIRWDTVHGKRLQVYGYPPNELPDLNFTPAELMNVRGHVAWVRDVVVLPGAERMVSAGNDRVLLVWDMQSGEVVQHLLAHTAVVFCLAVSRDGRRLLSGGYDKTVILWNLETGEVVHQMETPEGTTSTVAFHPTEPIGASGGEGGIIRLWDLDKGREIHRFEGHEGLVTSIVFSVDGRQLLSGGADKTIRLWEIP